MCFGGCECGLVVEDLPMTCKAVDLCPGLIKTDARQFIPSQRWPFPLLLPQLCLTLYSTLTGEAYI